ncbi:MAG: ABC transporter substrate-binding protein [Candidatus Omnitrophica bacterium]|nr:ABC transporter substrate-binding protein [Candidatus Omnitrophota bacterium]
MPHIASPTSNRTSHLFTAFRTSKKRGHRLLTIGHSPDPDDAFMFFALTQGKLRLEGFRIREVLADIQSLNERAMRAELDVTAISAAAYPYVAEDYGILASGASVGRGYGPVVVATTPLSPGALRGRLVAIPGPLTTAALLLRLYAPGVKTVIIPFDRIMSAVKRGQVSAGVVIHEGQLTFAQQGFHEVLNLGKAWEQETALPIPLGLDVVKRSLGAAIMGRISQGLSASIRYAHAHPRPAVAYAMTFGRGLPRKLTEEFVQMYVNADTVALGDDGVQALKLLFRRAHQRKLIPCNPHVTLI